MKKHNSSRRGSENGFWQSYSDIMASLLLVFIMVMTGAILQVMVEYEKDKAELDHMTSIAASLAADNAEKAEQLKKILGIREEIIAALVEEFSKGDMEGKLTVDDQTGAIVFDSKLLFDFDGTELAPEGKAFLKEFLPKYVNILLSDRFSDYLAEIIIEGHSDQTSGYIYNMELSQQRAFAVAEYALLDTEIFPQQTLDLVRPYITVNGRSKSEPIRNPDGTIDAEASRRVELQFRLKEDEMIKLMNSTLNGDD